MATELSLISEKSPPSRSVGGPITSVLVPASQSPPVAPNDGADAHDSTHKEAQSFAEGANHAIWLARGFATNIRAGPSNGRLPFFRRLIADTSTRGDSWPPASLGGQRRSGESPSRTFPVTLSAATR